MRRALLQLLLAGLLLAGQHGALSHAVWHLHDFLPGHGHHEHAGDTPEHAGNAHEHGDEHSSQADLCGLHAAFDTMLSGGAAAPPLLLAADVADIAPAAAPVRHDAQTRVAFHSRAPPAVS
jgi:hypothetical protein